jgi:PleD family two-component response regulator
MSIINVETRKENPYREEEMTFRELLAGEGRETPLRKPRILVVDDDPNIRELITETLGYEEYHILEAANGKEALLLSEREFPDLIVLDIMMPDLDGMEVCRRLRKGALTNHIPIIMLTAKGVVEDKIKGMESGADDYITKPFDPMELEARINMHLRRSIREGEASPLTGLPGNRAIEEAIETRIRAGKKFAVCYVDLDDFKAFNDRYGFFAGSEVIKMTAQIILKVLRTFGNEEDFCGHIGGDDFIIITKLERTAPICEEIIRLFDNMIPAHYDPLDLRNGYIVSVDRSGEIKRFPIMSISIAIVHNTYRELNHPGKIAQIAAEVKRYAKSLEGSNYVYDRRKKD